MTSFTAEIKPVCACMCVSCDFPGNISRGWNSSVTVESINNSVLPQNSFFLFLPIPLSSSNSNHKQHLFLPSHCAGPNSLRACSKVSWKAAKNVHILSFGTAYERWKLRCCCCCYHAQRRDGRRQLLGEQGHKTQVQSTESIKDGPCPATLPISKRQSLMSRCNRDSTQSWCCKERVMIPTAQKQQKENAKHQLSNNGESWGFKPRHF